MGLVRSFADADAEGCPPTDPNPPHLSTPMPDAAGISAEGSAPGRRLRASEQSTHGRDRRPRSRRLAGESSFVRCLGQGRRADAHLTHTIHADTSPEDPRSGLLRESRTARGQLLSIRREISKKIRKTFDNDHKPDLDSPSSGDCGDPSLAIRTPA
jgi:hypothetical protein